MTEKAKKVGYYFHFNNTDRVIEEKVYSELLKAQRMLLALEAAGVENWDGYSAAIDLFNSNWKPANLNF